MRRGRRGKRRLELVRVVGVAGLVVRVDGWGGEEPVRRGGVSRVVGVCADAQGDLVDQRPALGMGKAKAMLEERRWGARGQDGVMGGGERPAGCVGEQGVRGGRGVCGAVVVQMCEGVCVDCRRDVGVRSQGPIVAVPLLVAVVCTVRLHLAERCKTKMMDSYTTSKNSNSTASKASRLATIYGVHVKSNFKFFTQVMWGELIQVYM